MTPLDIGEIASEIVALIDKGGHAGVELTLTASPNISKIKGDIIQIRSVVMNLVLNGMSAVDGNGKVEIGIKKDGDFVVISIKDNGKGSILPTRAEFSSRFTQREKKGSGLGSQL